MSARRRPRNIVVRPAAEADGPALASFRCATGPVFESEVEDFIHDRALRLALSPKADYRLLVVGEDDRLIACAAHHSEGFLVASDGGLKLATRLQLLALSRGDQGRRLGDGQRLSDLVMQTLIFDALETREAPLLTAIVARENLRSIAMCERNGLRSQVGYDSRHIRISGHFTIRASPAS